MDSLDSPPPTLGSTITGRTLSVVVAGAGRQGQTMARCFQASAGWDLQAVCDVEVQRARMVASSIGRMPVFESLEETLDQTTPDAIAIATPVGTRRDVVMSALRAGFHVLVEEPMAACLSDGLDMVYEAASQGLILMVDHAPCYSPAVRTMQRLIQSGMLGELLFVDSTRAASQQQQGQAADVLWTLAAADLAVLDFILPGRLAVTEVSATRSDPGDTGCDSAVHLNLRLRNNSTAHLHITCAGGDNGRRMVIGGSSRTLVWEGLDSGQEGVRQAVREFGRCIRSGGPTLMKKPSALVILSVLEAGRRSLSLENQAIGQGAGP